MSLPVCKNVADEHSAITKVSHCESSVFKREQLKGHHTIYKPAGRSHPDFALPNPFWAMISQVLIDDTLCAEVLIRIRFGMVCDCIDGLSHVTVWLGLTDKESTCNPGDLGSIPGLGRSPGEWKGYPF